MSSHAARCSRRTLATPNPGLPSCRTRATCACPRCARSTTVWYAPILAGDTHRGISPDFRIGPKTPGRSHGSWLALEPIEISPDDPSGSRWPDDREPSDHVDGL